MRDIDFIIQTSPWLDKPNFRYDVIKRNQYSLQDLEINSRLIRILLGAQRVGKTSILYSHINELLNKENNKRIFLIPGIFPK